MLTRAERKLSASAECGSNEEVPDYWQNRNNLLTINGGQECRSSIFIKLYYNYIQLVSDRVSPRCPANIIYYAISAVIETNILPEVIY